jgi:uncharacterized protein involved in exopolysaccharide biosynthesis
MLSYADWLDAIHYRWKLVAWVTAGFAVLALLYLAVAPRVYAADAALLLDSHAPNPFTDDKNDDQANNRAAIATQADLIRSPQVADRAASLSGLSRSPRYIAKWRWSTEGDKPFQLWLRERLLGALTVEPGKDTNVLKIRVRARDAAEAAAIANGFARGSVTSQHRLRIEPAKAYANWLTSRMDAARTRVIEAQQALSNFVRATGITNDGDLSAEGTQMAEVATQLAVAEGRAAAARQSGFTAPQSKGDAERSVTIQELRKAVSEKAGRLADLQAVFGPEYPDVQRTQSELNALQQRLTAEVSAATKAFGAARDAQSAAQRAATSATESRLRALSDQQRTRMEAMGYSLAEYSRLKNEFAGAQHNYNDLNQRLARMRLQSTLPRTEVQVLDLADIPLEPEWPKAGLVLLLALALGFILGGAAAIILEAMNPRVRNWLAIQRTLGVQVIGPLTLPKSSKREPFLIEARSG